MSGRAKTPTGPAALLLGVLAVLLLSARFCWADVIINVLAINGKDVAVEKDVEFSLPGEITPEDILDSAGLTLDYNVKDSGYRLQGKVALQPKETRTFRVRVRDIWRIEDEDLQHIKKDIDDGFREMGGERSQENGQALRDKLLTQLEYVVSEQKSSAESGIDQRIDAYRSHRQTLNDVRTKAKLIDYWRSDASDDEARRPISYNVEIFNSTDKTKKFRQQHYLPKEVRPEYIIDRQGYEVRFDEKSEQMFLFREEDLAPKEKKSVRFSIRDVWFIHQKDIRYIRNRAKITFNVLKSSVYAETAKTLLAELTSNLDLIDIQQATLDSDIKLHIGAYRENQKRFKKAEEALDALEKLMSRQREELEKSKVKNVMQKIGALKSLARISKALFDKRPTLNTAWRIIGMIMIFLAILTIIYFITSFIRSGREKKQEEIRLSQDKKQGNA